MSAIALRDTAQDYRARFEWSAPSFDPAAELRTLAGKLAREGVARLTDALALFAVLSPTNTDATLDLANLPPQALEAFQAAYPNVDLQSLDGVSAEGLTGYLNAWQGKLFEVSVRDQLNAGESVGPWALAAGQKAELAQLSNQPGWDLVILNADGTTADVIQLKATESASYVRDALERYPDIPVIATSDVASGLIDEERVTIAEHGTDELSGTILADGAGSALQASDVLMPTGIVLVTEAMAVMAGQKSAESAIESAATRGTLSVVASVIGALIGLALGPAVGAGAAFAARIALGREAKAGSSTAVPKQQRGQPRPVLPKPALAPPAQPQAARNSSRPGAKPRTVRDLARIVGFLRQRYVPSPILLPVTGAVNELVAIPLVSRPQLPKPLSLWVGVMKSTGAELVYDPDIQHADDQQVWIFSVRRQCIRAMSRVDLRPLVRTVPPPGSARCIETYLAWKKRNAKGLRTHLQRYARVDTIRPAYAGVAT